MFNDETGVVYQISGRIYDTATKEQGELYRISTNNTNEPIRIYFDEEYSFIEMEKGLFYIPYTNTEPIFLTEHSQSSGAFDYYNGKVYFIVEADAEAYIISIDVETQEINEVVSLVESNGQYAPIQKLSYALTVIIILIQEVQMVVFSITLLTKRKKLKYALTKLSKGQPRKSTALFTCLRAEKSDQP